MRHFTKLARTLTLALALTGLTFGAMGLATVTQSPAVLIADVGHQRGDPDVG